MTGPEHYREAENALAALGTELYAPARRGLTKGLGPSDLLAYAQVHATLALAQANAGLMMVTKGDVITIVPEQGPDRLMAVAHVEHHLITLTDLPGGAS